MLLDYPKVALQLKSNIDKTKWEQAPNPMRNTLLQKLRHHYIYGPPNAGKTAFIQQLPNYKFDVCLLPYANGFFQYQ